MALRMILTSIVVTMSLPLPSYDRFEKIAIEINQEIGAAFAAIENELASRTAQEKSKLSTSVTASETPAPESENRLESPLDMAFDVVVEDFVREASEMSVEQAQATVAIIPAEPVAHPLPPALSAIEALIALPDNDLRQSADASVKISPSCSPEWSAILENRCGSTETIDDATLVTAAVARHVRSADIGPWENVVDSSEDAGLEESCELASLVQSIVNAEKADKVVMNQSLSAEWSAVIGVEEICPIEIAQLHASSSDSDQPDQIIKATGSNVRDALRKTVEALAAWSEVVVRSY